MNRLYPRRASKGLLALVAALVLMAAAWREWGAIRSDGTAAVRTHMVAPALPDAHPGAYGPPAAAAPTPRTSDSASSASEPAKSLALEIDRWLTSGRPEDAMLAYSAVKRCLLNRRLERAPAERYEWVNREGTAAAICGDIRSDQIVSRGQWLVKAAEAGVHGAAFDFAQEGPGGNNLLYDLDVGGDPLIASQEWLDQRDRYIDLGLGHCDGTLAVELSLFAQGVPADPAAAKSYWMGRLICPDSSGANAPPLVDDPEGQRLINGLLSAKDPPH